MIIFFCPVMTKKIYGLIYNLWPVRTHLHHTEKKSIVYNSSYRFGRAYVCGGG